MTARSEPPSADGQYWGEQRFGIGLLVGSKVTPTQLFQQTRDEPGGLGILLNEGDSSSGADPAQVLRCPCCGSILAVTPDQLIRDAEFEIHWILMVNQQRGALPDLIGCETAHFVVISGAWRDEGTPIGTLSIRLRVKSSPGDSTAECRDSLFFFWNEIHRKLGANGWVGYLQSCNGARVDRPGYFIRAAKWGRMAGTKPIDFEIFCPSPDCQLNSAAISWSESRHGISTSPISCFSKPQSLSRRIPIPGYTVDAQIHARCPTMVVATVDKMAMLPFRPEAGTLFGAVDVFDINLGYWRRGVQYPNAPAVPSFQAAGPFLPPEIVLQDELHLIEGPLGSMVGIYETALDTLMSRHHEGNRSFRPLYIASSATIRAAGDQIQALYNRRLQIFPPPGLNASDSFFSRILDGHPLDPARKGRVYVGICAPGCSPLIPPRNIWSALFQFGKTRRDSIGSGSLEGLDGYWTIVNYFNAIRELAGASRLMEQDVLERLRKVHGAGHRAPDHLIELSSRTESMQLPALLDRLDHPITNVTKSGMVIDMLHTTSMFGTGVDVSRLALMIVHGQPKTAASYIQATGRVGRSVPGLVITLHRAARPRDLSHYELFTGFHGALYRHVEPITVAPFSPRARERAFGPLQVLLLRLADSLNGNPVPSDLRVDPAAIQAYRNDPAVICTAGILEARAQAMPDALQPNKSISLNEANSDLDDWNKCMSNPQGLSIAYNEWTINRKASKMVVLGDRAHASVIPDGGQLAVEPACAFLNTPTSLRDVEATAAFAERAPSRRRSNGPSHQGPAPRAGRPQGKRPR